MLRELTDKQNRFVDEYLIDSNAAQAALRAGYKENYGRQLLAKTNVLEEIEKRQQKLQNKTEITQERILRELATIAFDSTTDFATKSGPIIKGATHKTTSKLKAIELTAKMLGMFDDTQREKQESEVDGLSKSLLDLAGELDAD